MNVSTPYTKSKTSGGPGEQMDIRKLGRLFRSGQEFLRSFSFPGGTLSHVTPDRFISSDPDDASHLIPKPPHGQKPPSGQEPERVWDDLNAALAAGVGPQAEMAAKMYENTRQLTDLKEIARTAIIDRKLTPDFPPEVIRKANRIKAPAFDPGVKDLRDLLWVSIDNDDSKDLDQISVAQELPGGDTRVLVAIADVDALVPKDSLIDRQARLNTATIYTPAKNFPMLPERLSNDLTSLNLNQDRLAVVTEMVIGRDGSIRSSNLYRAMVKNHAKLAYNGVGAWLENRGETPDAVKNVKGVAEQIRIQDRVAQTLKEVRERNGAIELDNSEIRVVMENGKVVDLLSVEKNRATELIENLMVAVNGVSARFLREHGFPVLERVVEKPKYWDDIVSVAASYGEKLPENPDSGALDRFLEKRKKAAPDEFPELALTVLKLIGRGRYAVERPGQVPVGHFGLAIREYSHSTAPNRRYPDLVSQRLIKAAVAGQRCPYTLEELEAIADHCSDQEAAIKKVGRQLLKSAAALFLSTQVGEEFQAIVTAVTHKGTWIRLQKPPVEGRLENPGNARPGEKLTVRLAGTDVEKGYIDFIPKQALRPNQQAA